ncbi:MAG: type I restriction enzyme HsdR N-terminal domain-containing protein [Bacteroidales bacterium]|nr:type I restriction enzyme HsdR N-terminal domain-containing protein [Bacteroidales bacterium]
MDFSDQITHLADRVEKLKPQLLTEEATKNALIMPFIQALGYDVFNPMEVVPEFTADVGTKKGEKVDYAILLNNKVTILIECKGVNDSLVKHDTQLIRYFHACEAKFAILTNGQIFKFYTDLEDHNKLDSKPFFEIDLLNIKEQQIAELKKFHKAYFDIDKIVGTASELKYSNEIKNILNNEIEDPSEPFIRFFLTQIYQGRATANVIEQFKSIVKKSLAQWLSDRVSNRLKSALEKENESDKIASESVEETADNDEPKRNIETTEEELEGFYIIRAILRQKVDGARITHRDTQTYFGVLLDDNNRKPVCRLYFNGAKKRIELFDEAKKGTKYDLADLNDIYNHSDYLLKTIGFYE